MARLPQPLKRITSRAQEIMDTLLYDPEENQMLYFTSILDEFKELIEIYTNLFPELIEQTRSKISHSTFAQGGDRVHRGIHCPSPILSLLVGCNAGFEIESPDKATDNFFKYIFDAEDHLIAISHYDFQESSEIPDEMEFTIRKGQDEYGISFHNDWNEVTRVSKVAFLENGQPKYYAVSKYDESEPELMFLHYEEYVYEGDTPVRAEVYFGISPELNMFEKHSFILEPESH